MRAPHACVIMEFINLEGKIPAAEWFKLIVPIMQEGYRLQICPEGRSMIPFLKGGRDEAVLSLPGSREFQVNDIVLYKIENNIHVLHRIYRIDKSGIYTLGDAQTNIEGPFQRDDIIAVADYIIRKGKKIDRNNRKYLLLVTIWRLLRPLRPIIIRSHKMLCAFRYSRRKRKAVPGS